MSENKIFGIELHKIRVEKRVTMRELSHAIKKKISYIEQVERGDVIPDIEVVHKIEQRLGLEKDYLYSFWAFDVIVSTFFSVCRSLSKNIIDAIEQYRDIIFRHHRKILEELERRE